MEKVDLAVVIGRFQPFHRQHLELVKEALVVADRVIIFIGSANQPRSEKNPLTYAERQTIITTSLINAGIDIGLVRFSALEDYDTDEEWAGAINGRIPTGLRTTIVGCHKRGDNSTYYLDLFPQYEYHELQQRSQLSATIVRNVWYNRTDEIELLAELQGYVCDLHVARHLVNMRNRDWFKNMRGEKSYIEAERAKLSVYPYKGSLNVATADAIIVNQHRELCFIIRKGYPFKGCLALVGGHKEDNETFLDCAIREANEETGIVEDMFDVVGIPVIGDNPDRDPVCTKVTVAYTFKFFGEKNELTAADDADSIVWIPVSKLSEYKDQIAFDHYEIVQRALVNMNF